MTLYLAKFKDQRTNRYKAKLFLRHFCLSGKMDLNCTVKIFSSVLENKT